MEIQEKVYWVLKSVPGQKQDGVEGTGLNMGKKGSEGQRPMGTRANAAEAGQ